MKKSKKRQVPMALKIVAVLVIILIGFDAYLYFTAEKPIPEPEKITPEPEVVPMPRFARTFEECNIMPAGDEKTDCFDRYYSIKGYADLDISTCKMVKNTIIRDLCIQRVAAKTDPHLCREMSDLKIEHCYAFAAEANRDYSWCDYVEEGFERGECISVVSAMIARQKNDYTGCRGITVGEYRNNCYESIFIFNGKNFCRLMEEGEEKTLCLSMTGYSDAVYYKETSRCNEIPLDAYRKVCYIIIDSLNRGDKFAPDSDNDGFNDADELFMGTDPFNPDTDGDGVKDGEERGTDPTRADN